MENKTKTQLNYEVMKEQEDKIKEYLIEIGENELEIEKLFKGIRQTEREKTKEEFDSKVQKVQKELKDKLCYCSGLEQNKLPENRICGICEEIDKIFAENFGLNEGEENKDG